MMTRWTTALHKLFFCYRITADFRSFFNLVVNAKRYRYGKPATNSADRAIPYQIRLHGKRKTIYLRTFAGDMEIFFEVFWKQCYRLPDQWKLNYAVVVDLGANIGMTSLYFSSQYQVTIYAVEPDNNNMKLLLQNLADEISTGGAYTLHAAVAAEDTILYARPQEKAYNTKVSTEATSMPVQAVSMDRLCSKFKLNKIDLLKIDIEGAEESILSGDLEWLDKVNMIVMEIHAAAYRPVCEKLLISRGFTMGWNGQQVSGQSSLLWAMRR